MRKEDIFDTFQQYVMPTSKRMPVIFVKGKGMTLTDIHGKTYLDFFPGWGVSNVGHCHPKVMAGVRDQIDKLIHMPNNFYTPQQGKLAQEIIRTSFPGKVFFCNSGAEACEAAIKFSRIYGQGKRYEIITMTQSFHGRTLGALTATGQVKYQQGFTPLPQGFRSVPFNDLTAVQNALTDKTVAILLEPVQGEGGIHVCEPSFIQGLRKLCDDKGLLLIFDEVQTGMGRTGKMYAFQHYGVTPDLMMLAKALGGGLPIGALVARKAIADTFQPGMHASTFGGSPLVCKAALGVFKAIRSGKMLANAQKMGEYLKEKLLTLKQHMPCISRVRGLGLMVGIELTIDGTAVFEGCLRRGLIINCTQGCILRVMPALNVTRKQIDKAVGILEKALQEVITTIK
jgi:predicted acetylornithine/succinylornithine family transaminase